MTYSLLDNDLYKFTMQQAVCETFPRSIVEYKFIDRNNRSYPPGFGKKLKTLIENMSMIRMTPDEKTYLSNTCKFFTPVYLDFLSHYSYDPSEVDVYQDKKTGKLDITIRGYWYRTILWEVPLLAMISELYFQMTSDYNHTIDKNGLQTKLLKKKEFIKQYELSVADFGTRRRYSKLNHNFVLEKLHPVLIGSSNVFFAKKYGIKPIGTQAHEWIMYHGARYGYQSANYMSLQNWVNTYNGDLGIALTDTFTTDIFLQAFDSKFSKLFDGVRHDSGSPYEFIEKIKYHYSSLGIDSSTKTIIFSDSLYLNKAKHLKGCCDVVGLKSSFGIGTSLTNDVGVSPLNIVIKLHKIYDRGDTRYAVKLSDDVGKYTGNLDAIQNALSVLKIQDVNIQEVIDVRNRY